MGRVSKNKKSKSERMTLLNIKRTTKVTVHLDAASKVMCENHVPVIKVENTCSTDGPKLSNLEKQEHSEESTPSVNRRFTFQQEQLEKDVNESFLAPSYIFLSIQGLQNFLCLAACSECSEKCLSVSITESHGFAHKLTMSCSSCGYSNSTYSSSRAVEVSKRPSFDVNKRLVKAFNSMGKGYGAMEIFAMSMNMKPMSHATFDNHVRKIHKASTESADYYLQAARKEVRKRYIQLDPSLDDQKIINITISYDGTWFTRGHTSNYGVGCIIDVETGYVVDYQVISKYCQTCEISKNCLGENSPEYYFWKQDHKQFCDAGYTGSSVAMEMTAALSLWQRSEQYGFRYATMVSDGDCKTFSHLKDNNVYGNNVILRKEECINHVAKRMGTALRNLVKTEKQRGTTLGGRKDGSLKDSTINNICKYYRNAIYKNTGNKDNMKTAIYAILYHCRSTDQKPEHHKCPKGETSWCFYNRALAKNDTPGAHKNNVHNPLSGMVVQKMLPVFQRLASDDLLERCLEGRTQNGNESLHSAIWSKCPKDKFVTKNRITIAVCDAVTEYNFGHSYTISKRQEKLGLSPGRHTLMLAKQKDARTAIRRTKQQVLAFKKYRQIVKLAKLRAEEAKRQQEGPSYAAGSF